VRCQVCKRKLREVIPFKCADILTCLDGYASPPTFSQCVALGPVTSESIRLDYNALGLRT